MKALIYVLSLCTIAVAQIAPLPWTRTIDSGYEYDMLNDLCSRPEGGVCCVGAVWSGSYDPEAHVLLLGAAGSIEWYERIEQDCVFQGVCRTDENTYVLIGTMAPFSDPTQSVFICEIDPNEQPCVLNERTIPGAGWGFDIIQMQDSGFAFLVRGEDNLAYVYKVDRDLDPVWQTNVGTTPFLAGYAPGNALEETQDGLFLVGGYNTDYGICGQLFALSSSTGDQIASGNT